MENSLAIPALPLPQPLPFSFSQRRANAKRRQCWRPPTAILVTGDALTHCAGIRCADEIAEPAANFVRHRGVMFCPRCWAAFQDEWELYDLPTQFELECGRLGLTCNEAAQAQSKELRKWCRQHADSRYIPEKLLEAWGIKVLIADFEYPDWMRGALVSPSKRCASAE